MLFTFLFFFFNDTATTEIYTLSLHDALPISSGSLALSPTRRCSSPLRTRCDPRNRQPNAFHSILPEPPGGTCAETGTSRGSPSPRPLGHPRRRDRKSTRLNSSHTVISYAVFC